MSQALRLTLIAALTALATPNARAQGAPPQFREEFLARFDESMSKLVGLAEATPPVKYVWSPGVGVMPVAQVYAHITRYNFGYPSENMGVAPPAGVRLDTLEQMRNKTQVVALLRRSGAYVRDAVQGMDDAQLARTTTLYGRQVPQWSVLFQLLAHMNEHLGQSIAYARMNGVVPPWSQ